MNTNTWLWIALFAILVFCCVVPMLLKRKRRGRSHDAAKREDQSAEM